MEFIRKDKLFYTSNSSLNLSRNPSEDQVSSSQTIGFGVRNLFWVWHWPILFIKFFHDSRPSDEISGCKSTLSVD